MAGDRVGSEVRDFDVRGAKLFGLRQLESFAESFWQRILRPRFVHMVFPCPSMHGLPALLSATNSSAPIIESFFRKLIICIRRSAPANSQKLWKMLLAIWQVVECRVFLNRFRQGASYQERIIVRIILNRLVALSAWGWPAGIRIISPPSTR